MCMYADNIVHPCAHKYLRTRELQIFLILQPQQKLKIIPRNMLAVKKEGSSSINNENVDVKFDGEIDRSGSSSSSSNNRHDDVDDDVLVRHRRRPEKNIFSNNNNTFMTRAKSSGESEAGADAADRGVPARKAFCVRNSVLTDLLKISHFQAIRSVFIAIILLTALSTLVTESLSKEQISKRLSVFTWNVATMPVAWLTWFGIQFSTVLLVYLPFRLWTSVVSLPPQNRGRRSLSRFDQFMLVYFFLYELALFLIPYKIIFTLKMPPAVAMFVSFEQVRIMMKIYSFLREKIADFYFSQKTSDPQKTVAAVSLSHFLYFLFAPTLIYRNEYPKSAGSRINWRAVGQHFAGVVVGYLFIGHIMQHYAVPTFSSIDYTHLTLRDTILLICNSIVPGLAIQIIGFYCLLHAWQNMFAELLHFGDRHFYSDWWNSINLAVYYRTWNIVVHDFLHQYIYRDFVLAWQKRNKNKSTKKVRFIGQWLTVLISAIFHEYLTSLVMQSFFPLMFIQFAGIGMIMFFIQKGGRNRHLDNISIWMSILAGNGMNLSLYFMEYYARQQCPSVFVEEHNKWKDFYVPRLLTCGRSSNKTI